MSNDANSQQQAAPPNIAGISDGANVTRVAKPGAFHLFRLADALKTSPKPVHFCPFLLDSDPPVEFGLSYTKQRAGKILPDTRTHSKDFGKLPNSSTASHTQNSPKTPRHSRPKGAEITPPPDGVLRQFPSNISAQKIAFLTESAPQVEFDLNYRKQRTEKFLTEARTHIRDFRKLLNSCPIFRAKKSSKGLRLRPLQHLQLAQRSQRPSRSRRHRPHRRLVVELLGRKIGNQPRLNRRINFFDPRLQRPLATKIQNSLNLSNETR